MLTQFCYNVTFNASGISTSYSSISAAKASLAVCGERIRNSFQVATASCVFSDGSSGADSRTRRGGNCDRFIQLLGKASLAKIPNPGGQAVMGQTPYRKQWHSRPETLVLIAVPSEMVLETVSELRLIGGES